MEKIIGLRSVDEQLILFGPRDKHLRMIRDHFRIRITARHGELRLEGPDDRVMDAFVVFMKLLDQIRRSGTLTDDLVENMLIGGPGLLRADNGANNGGTAMQPYPDRQQSGGRAGKRPPTGYDDERFDKPDRRPRSPHPQSGRHEAVEPGGDRSGGLWRDDANLEVGGQGEFRRLAKPQSNGQAEYMKAILDHDLVFAVGPAGTGKTFLATAMAVDALNSGRVRKIVLVRPAVEAGEKLGFLPGDYQAKINPYLRPIFDALGALLDYGALRRYMERDVIEVAPLAYMRGRTLENAFIILDEAQNTTPQQMMMFLTRFGRGSKVVVTGDITQIDLPMNQISGLADAVRVLRKVPGIAFIKLNEKDIVRHNLVQRIVAAYESAEDEAQLPLFRHLKGKVGGRPTRFTDESGDAESNVPTGGAIVGENPPAGITPSGEPADIAPAPIPDAMPDEFGESDGA